jgi:K+-sensing histidine kinase KdpD
MNADHSALESAPSSVPAGAMGSPYRRSAAARYGVAIIAVMIAFAIRYGYSVFGDVADRLVFTFFVPAAIVAAWYGGLGPGILATLAGLVIGDYFFMSARVAWWPLKMREAMAIGVYGVTTLLCVVLCETLHKRIRGFEHALMHERHHDHLTLPVMAQEFADFLTRYYLQASSRNYAYQSWPLRRSFVLRYAVTIVAVMLAFGFRYWLFGTADHRFPFIFFVPAAMIAAWYGGMAAGLLATAAGLMLGDYFFLSEHEAMGAVRENERMSIGMYAVTTTLCVMLFENLHDRIRRLEHAFDRVRHHTHPHDVVASARPQDATAAH